MANISCITIATKYALLICRIRFDIGQDQARFDSDNLVNDDRWGKNYCWDQIELSLCSFDRHIDVRSRSALKVRVKVSWPFRLRISSKCWQIWQTLLGLLPSTYLQTFAIEWCCLTFGLIFFNLLLTNGTSTADMPSADFPWLALPVPARQLIVCLMSGRFYVVYQLPEMCTLFVVVNPLILKLFPKIRYTTVFCFYYFACLYCIRM